MQKRRLLCFCTLLCICFATVAGPLSARRRCLTYCGGYDRDGNFLCETRCNLSDCKSRDWALAFKTNLLYDLATAINVEAEVAIYDRWSIAGEWVFPWWLHNKKQYAFEIGAGTLEGRYWFGDRAGRPKMTGWFAGVYAGGGYYDLEWNKKGKQGEFFHAGVSGGFAHSISKSDSWRMEYSLGLGYMASKFRSYDAMMGTGDKWYLERQSNGTYRWFGPTRAKVSLVWVPNWCRKTKGDYR